MRTDYSYCTGVTDLMHGLILQLFPQGGDLAIDATLGNGHDTDFLAQYFKEVIAVDIQPSCIDRYEAAPNVRKYCMNHSKIERFHANPVLIVYNLGYLPGADKEIRTNAESTLESLRSALEMIRPGGFLMIALYYAHDGGAEAHAVLDYAAELSSQRFGVIHQTFLNRGNYPPSLLIVERKKEINVHGNNES